MNEKDRKPAPQKSDTHARSKQLKREKKNPPVVLENLFETKKIPLESVKVLREFDKIVLGVRNLNSKQKYQLPLLAKKLSHLLTDTRSDRRLGYMNDNSLLTAYINYFMWWNLVRLTRIFVNLPENTFSLNDGDVVLDIGSGPLTIPAALWLSRPDLRSKKLVFYCVDLSQNALSAGEEIFLSIAAKTIKDGEEPWKIVRVKGALGIQIKEKPSLITCGNIFNEATQNAEMPSDFLAKKYIESVCSYFEKESEKAQTVFIVEPGDPHSARLVSLMRDSLMRRGFFPVSPCPHFHSCPMEGRTKSNPGGKWCNFAFSTESVPQELLKLSEKSKLTKDRAVLSFVLSKKEGTPKEHDKKTEKKSLTLRIASDAINLPGFKKNGYYACSELGLLLAVDDSNLCPKNGDLIKIDFPRKTDLHDRKTGALIVSL